MAEIKDFQEGWNKKHKDYLEAKEKALEAGAEAYAEVERFELRRQNTNMEVTTDDVYNMLSKVAYQWMLAQEALALDPNKKVSVNHM